MMRMMFSAFLAIPFYFLWNHLAPVYAPQLPGVYLHVPFWDCIGLFVLIAIVKQTLFSWREHHCHTHAKWAYKDWKFS